MWSIIRGNAGKTTAEEQLSSEIFNDGDCRCFVTIHISRQALDVMIFLTPAEL